MFKLLISDSKQKLNKFLIVTTLFFISMLLACPCAYAVEGNEVDKDVRTTVSSGGKKTKEEIRNLIQQMRARREAGLDEDPLERWLTKDRTEKYAVQKKFAYSVHSLKKSLEEISRRIEQDADVHSETTELLKLRDIIKEADDALKTEFAKVEQKFIDEGLPDVILNRHRNMVEDHNKNICTLFDNFDEIERLAGEEAWDEICEIISQIKDQLDEYQAIKPSPLLNNGLPHGFRYVEAPRVLQEEPTIPSVAPNVPENGAAKAPVPAVDTGAIELLKVDEGRLSPMFMSGQPAPEDLDPTIDVQITQDIIDLAASLDNSPLKMYEYVRNNLDFEPYLGSRKGSQETLNQMSGNDYDLSSLLIALLRAADIPARYVRGIVELSPEKAMNWLGVDDAATAGSILTTAGMEGVNIIDGEGNVVSIRFKHVWVEAYIPYTNYRGIPVDDTGKMWVSMDPSFKGYTYQPGVDILSEMGFDAEAFIDNYISTFHEPSPVELYMQQINDYLAANHPELSYENIVRIRTITQDTLDFLPGSLPFTVRSVDSDFAEISSDKRYKLRFHLYNGGTTFINYTANLPEIAGKRITISYIAATQADQEVIDSYGDLYDTPPYLVNLKPVLKIDGNDMAVGTASIGMGLTHSSDMHFTTPVGEINEMPVVSNSIIAGTYQAVGVDTGRIDPEIFMPGSDESTPATDDLTGGKLWKTAMGYLDRIETYDDEVAKTMQMVVTKDVSEAIVENTILVTFSFGTPQTFEWKGLVVDADRCIVGPFSVDGDDSKQKPFMVLSGADGSISENRIFEDMYDEEAVSTIKILELASDTGIPVYKFNSGNIGSIYSSLNLSSSVEGAIYNAVLVGHEVTVPRDNITYSEWYGTGYIDMDQATGAAGYIISGGHSGGATVDIWIAWKVFLFTIFRDLCDTNPITANITFPPANSYFPSLDLWDFLFNNQLHFDVTYTICYEGGGTRTVYEIFRPHYPYPPGNYTFYAGCGTGATRDYTMFGVEIETPDGEKAIAGCDSITLNTKLTPSTPPSVTYQWGTSWTLGCLLGCGDGTFTPDNAASTEFQGTDGGNLTAKVEASNTYGTTKGKKSLKVIDVKSIKAADGSNEKEDRDPSSAIAESNTIYVTRSDTGVVNITVETDPSVSLAELPSGWRNIKKKTGSGSLILASTGKLSATVKKDVGGEITVQMMPCAGYTKYFEIKVVVMEIKLESVDDKFAPSVENLEVKYSILPPDSAAKYAKIEVFKNGDLVNPIFRDESIPKTATSEVYQWDGSGNRGSYSGKYISPIDSPYTVRVYISSESSFSDSSEDDKETKVLIKSITLTPSGTQSLIKPSTTATEIEKEIEAKVEIEKNDGAGAVTEILVKIDWSFEDPDDTATGNIIDSNGNAGDDNCPLANGGRRDTSLNMWKSVSGFTTSINKNIADSLTKPSGTDKGKTKIKFLASVISGDNYLVVAQVKHTDNTILKEEKCAIWSVRKPVTFPNIYNMNSGVDAGAIMTEANINPAFNGDGYTDYSRGTVSNLSTGAKSPKYVVMLLAPNASETPTAQELADYSGADAAKKATAKAAIEAKAQGWYNRNVANQGPSLTAYQTLIGASAPSIIGSRYFHPKLDGNNATGQTNYYPAGIQITIYMGTADPDDDWYQPQGAEFGGVIYIFLNSGNAARKQIVGRHEVGHASNHVSFGAGDHAASGSGCLMAPTGESANFIEESILRLRGWSP